MAEQSVTIIEMRKPQYSPSKLGTYLDCPRQYRFQYIDRFPRRAWASTSLGLSLHRTLQAVHGRGGASAIENGEAESLLEAHWNRAGYDHPDDEENARIRAREMLRKYLDSWAGREGLPIWVEKRATAQMAHFRLLGILDRLDRRTDGALEIVDYKSGRMPETPSERSVLQMVIYDRLVQENLGETPGAHSLHYLATDTRMEVPVDDGVRERVTKTILTTVERIESDSEWKPTTGSVCSSCDYVWRCPEGRRHTR